MDCRAVCHHPAAAISEWKWCHSENIQPRWQSDVLLKTHMPGLSGGGNDKKLLAEPQAWQESWTAHEDYLCCRSVHGGNLQERWRHAEKVIVRNQTHKITNTWHASQPADPWGQLESGVLRPGTFPGLRRDSGYQTWTSNTERKKKKIIIIQQARGSQSKTESFLS